MRTAVPGALLSVAGILISLQSVQGWSAPSFCRGYECPEYRLVHANENFEERFYNASDWITTEIEGTDFWTVRGGYNKLCDYLDGENEANQEIPMTRPIAITVLEPSSGEDRSITISVYVPPGTDLPKPTDSSITEFSLPAGIMFVRTFTGMPTESNFFDNLEALENDLKSAGKQYNPLRRIAAGYDGPLTLFKHNEVWLQGA
ncbi:hypothetical protein AGOR_G00119130 [Albula goreensis]|uniref:SOUL heme-binding protein n=1 Tax=Albula goreensis TaxID=1534307 RepID=A0A8T3DH58_9TELE|nr:hypothetical protein AGOR_G00119130 [Albula goreensis]